LHFLFPTKLKLGIALAVIGAIVITFTIVTDFDVKRNVEGYYLLKGRNGSLLELRDDLYLGDEQRLLLSIHFHELFKPWHWFDRHGKPPYLDYEWSDSAGCGYVRNILPGGRQLLTCFSRFKDDNGKDTYGLFVGGGLPATVADTDELKLDETGMAYFDGHRWYHIWCSVNEGMGSGTTMTQYPPSSWKFLGSKVLYHDDKTLVLNSSHEVEADGVPLSVERYAYFRAGDTYFVLSINIMNTGDRETSFYYCYGDDPWLGDFGSSKGNVGWVEDGIVKYVQYVDQSRYGFAGFYDRGNPAINEKGAFTGVSNFLQWLGDDEPTVYFSNAPDDFPEKNPANTPLGSNARFIGLQWGPLTLKPGQTENITLAVGMGEKVPGPEMLKRVPVKPEINLDYHYGGGLVKVLAKSIK